MDKKEAENAKLIELQHTLQAKVEASVFSVLKYVPYFLSKGDKTQRASYPLKLKVKKQNC